MKKAFDPTNVVAKLVMATEGRTLTTNEPWDYGWSQESYRHSADAAIKHGGGQAVRLSRDATISFEDACAALLQVPSVRDLYDSSEFWGLMASLVGTPPMDHPSKDVARMFTERISRLIKPPDSLVILPLANIAPLEKPLDIGPLLIGRASPELAECICRKAGRATTPVSSKAWWAPFLAGRSSSENAPVLCACVCPQQLGRAIDTTEETLEDLLSLTLVLQPDLDAFSLYSLRSAANRPGVRGLVVDRVSLTAKSRTDTDVARELAAEVFIGQGLGEMITAQWYGENAFPLERLLEDNGQRAVAARLLSSSEAIHKRLRVAARWHAEAHWELREDSAVLALGICFDAMLSEKGPSPGRVLSERFALLVPEPDRRRARYRRFQKEFYPARSCVAHGANMGLVDAKFVRDMATEVRFTFRKIDELTQELGIATEDQYQNMYDDLKWGFPCKAERQADT